MSVVDTRICTVVTGRVKVLANLHLHRKVDTSGGQRCRIKTSGSARAEEQGEELGQGRASPLSGVAPF